MLSTIRFHSNSSFRGTCFVEVTERSVGHNVKKINRKMTNELLITTLNYVA